MSALDAGIVGAFLVYVIAAGLRERAGCGSVFATGIEAGPGRRERRADAISGQRPVAPQSVR